jgi:hypothetical protein
VDVVREANRAERFSCSKVLTPEERAVVLEEKRAKARAELDAAESARKEAKAEKKAKKLAKKEKKKEQREKIIAEDLSRFDDDEAEADTKKKTPKLLDTETDVVNFGKGQEKKNREKDKKKENKKKSSDSTSGASPEDHDAMVARLMGHTDDADSDTNTSSSSKRKKSANDDDADADVHDVSDSELASLLSSHSMLDADDDETPVASSFAKLSRKQRMEALKRQQSLDGPQLLQGKGKKRKTTSSENKEDAVVSISGDKGSGKGTNTSASQGKRKNAVSVDTQRLQDRVAKVTGKKNASKKKLTFGKGK